MVKSSSAALEYTSKDYNKYLNDPSHPVVFESFRLENVKLDTHTARAERARKPLLEHLQQCTSYSDALLKDPDLVGRCARACIDYYAFNNKPDPRTEVHVLWFYGLPGSGKSYTARAMLDYVADKMDPDSATYSQKFYTTSSNLKWWTGYQGQRAVLIDELRWQCLGELGFPYLLRLLDVGRFDVEIKGGAVRISAHLWSIYDIYICCSCYLLP